MFMHCTVGLKEINKRPPPLSTTYTHTHTPILPSNRRRKNSNSHWIGNFKCMLKKIKLSLNIENTSSFEIFDDVDILFVLTEILPWDTKLEVIQRSRLGIMQMKSLKLLMLNFFLVVAKQTAKRVVFSNII